MAHILCPSCHTPLEPTGEVVIEGRTLSVYQCDRCTVPWELDGETFPAALTFAMDEDGNALDPTSGQPLPPPSKPSEN